MNRPYYSLLFVLGACLLLSLAYCPPYDLMLDDKEIFKYAGMAILRGNVPYRDFFDHKPPMIYFINYAGLLLGPWGLWLINTLLALLTTLFFFDRCRSYRLPFPWLFPLLFNLLIRDHLISLGINLTREYTAFFTIVFFCILLGKSRYRYFGMGLLSALIFFTQQDQVLPLIPFFIYLLTEDDASPLPARITRLAAGFLCVTLPLLSYFAVHHSLGYFWEDAFQFNFSVYSTRKVSLGDHFRDIKYALDAGNYEIPFMLALILGTTTLFLQHKKKKLLFASLAALILTLSPEFMGGRWSAPDVPDYFISYFLPLSAAICIVLFTVFAFVGEGVLTGKRALLPYALLLCCSLGYTALQHGSHLERRDKDPVMNVPELSYLRQQRPGDYQLYVFFDNQYIYFYNELKILAPSRWIYQHFWENYDNWDTDHGLLQGIGQDLLRHRTTYVIMDTTRLAGFRNTANREWWLSFMRTWYQPVSVPGRTESILWRLKN